MTAESERLRWRVTLFYQRYSPNDMAKVEKALQSQYTEEELFDTLGKKYQLPFVCDMRGAEREAVKKRLTKFYIQHNPKEMAKVEKALSFDMNEEELFNKLYLKYNVDLKALAAASGPVSPAPPAAALPSAASSATFDTSSRLCDLTGADRNAALQRITAFYQQANPAEVDKAEKALGYEMTEVELMERLERKYGSQAASAAAGSSTPPTPSPVQPQPHFQSPPQAVGPNTKLHELTGPHREAALQRITAFYQKANPAEVDKAEKALGYDMTEAELMERLENKYGSQTGAAGSSTPPTPVQPQFQSPAPLQAVGPNTKLHELTGPHREAALQRITAFYQKANPAEVEKAEKALGYDMTEAELMDRLENKYGSPVQQVSPAAAPVSMPAAAPEPPRQQTPPPDITANPPAAAHPAPARTPTPEPRVAPVRSSPPPAPLPAAAPSVPAARESPCPAPVHPPVEAVALPSVVPSSVSAPSPAPATTTTAVHNAADTASVSDEADEEAEEEVASQPPEPEKPKVVKPETRGTVATPSKQEPESTSLKGSSTRKRTAVPRTATTASPTSTSTAAKKRTASPRGRHASGSVASTAQSAEVQSQSEVLSEASSVGSGVMGRMMQQLQADLADTKNRAMKADAEQQRLQGTVRLLQLQLDAQKKLEHQVRQREVRVNEQEVTLAAREAAHEASVGSMQYLHQYRPDTLSNIAGIPSATAVSSEKDAEATAALHRRLIEIEGDLYNRCLALQSAFDHITTRTKEVEKAEGSCKDRLDRLARLEKEAAARLTQREIEVGAKVASIKPELAQLQLEQRRLAEKETEIDQKLADIQRREHHLGQVKAEIAQREATVKAQHNSNLTERDVCRKLSDDVVRREGSVRAVEKSMNSARAELQKLEDDVAKRIRQLLDDEAAVKRWASEVDKKEANVTNILSQLRERGVHINSGDS